MVNLVDWCVHIKPCKLADELTPDEQWEIHIYARKDCRECCSAPEQLPNRPLTANDRKLQRSGSGSGHAASAFLRGPASRHSAGPRYSQKTKYSHADNNRKSGNYPPDNRQQQRPMSAQLSTQHSRPISAQSVKFDISVQRRPVGKQSVKYKMQLRECPLKSTSTCEKNDNHLSRSGSILKRPSSAPSVKFDQAAAQDRPRNASSVKFDQAAGQDQIRPRSASSVTFDQTAQDPPPRSSAFSSAPYNQTAHASLPRSSASSSTTTFDGRMNQRPSSAQSIIFDGRVSQRPRSAQSLIFDGRVKDRPSSAQSGLDNMGRKSRTSMSTRKSQYHDPIPKGFEFRRKSVKQLEQLLARHDEEEEVEIDAAQKCKFNQPPPKDGAASKDSSGMIFSLATQYNLPVTDVNQIYTKFHSLDKKNTGKIDAQQFEQLVYILIYSGLLFCADSSNIDVHELVAQHGNAHDDGSGLVNFEAVLKWYVSKFFDQDLTLTKRQKEMRQLAAEHELDVSVVESVFEIFKTCDTDGSGAIDRDEFSDALLLLLKIKDPSLLSKERVTTLWDDADQDRSGEVTFAEFLPWYWSNFVQFDQYGNITDAASTYYKNVRRSSLTC